MVAKPLETNEIRAGARRHAPAEARRAQILEAALRCFSEKGYHEATMDDLAREAGLSKGSLYWHFRSKAEVFAGLSAAYSLELVQAWQALEAEHRGSVLELLGRIGELTLERFAAEEALLKAWAEFIVHREVRDLFSEVYRGSREVLGGLVQRGIEAGEMRAVDPEGLAGVLTAAIEGLLIQALVDSTFDPRRYWEVTWDVLSRGIAA